MTNSKNGLFVSAVELVYTPSGYVREDDLIPLALDILHARISGRPGPRQVGDDGLVHAALELLHAKVARLTAENTELEAEVETVKAVKSKLESWEK
jgi:hypothetical protein